MTNVFNGKTDLIHEGMARFQWKLDIMFEGTRWGGTRHITI